MKKSRSFSTHQPQNSLQFDLYALIYCTLYVELIILAINFIIQTILISEALGRRTFIPHSPTLVALKPNSSFINTLFITKQRDVLHKTTCGFS